MEVFAMYKRLELHNHTTQSDSSLSCQQLLEHMVSDQVDAVAITDHNTISGHPIMKQLIEELNLPIDCIYGMEYTTYYGHILCLNLDEYVPWDNINVLKPELLFHAVQEKGGLAGIAHPFSYGHPFARGCRFDMTINDYNCIDFVEIFNNPEPLHEVNEPGLLWWEDLVLSGYRLAATCGMDLHGTWDMGGNYATYISGVKDGDIALELRDAIKHQKTVVSKGPILEYTIDPEKKCIYFSVLQTKKNGYVHDNDTSYFLSIRTKKETFTQRISEKIPLCIPMDQFDAETILIPKLYENQVDIESLVCISPVIYL